MKKYTLIITMLFSLSGIAETGSAENIFVPSVYELLPGGTHFFEGNTKKGLAFLTSEVSLLTAGIALRRKVDDEMNVPLILAGQIYAIDKGDYSLKRLSSYLSRRKFTNSEVYYDPAPLTGLMTAPFRPDVFLSPFVLSWMAAGIIDGIIGYPGKTATWHDIDRVRLYGSTINRGKGTAWYETSVASISWGAAVSEEILFRGVLLPSLDFRYGKRTGLVASSLVFGFVHIFNPDIDRPAYFIGQATLAGFVLGYHVQHSGYRLDKAIAAHFWYNVFSMTTTWLANPKENPLGFSVQTVF